MKISTRSQYGLRALSRLKTDSFFSARQLAMVEAIPYEYLGKILSDLEKAKIVGVKRGAKGGYFLAQAPHRVTIGKIMNLLEKKAGQVPCTGPGCPRQKNCRMEKIWRKIDQSWNKTLDAITLADCE